MNWRLKGFYITMAKSPTYGVKSIYLGEGKWEIRLLNNGYLLRGIQLVPKE